MKKDYLDKFNLKNKSAVIFGGCGLIGKEITEAFILAGASVVVVDINKKIGKKLEKKFASFPFKFLEFDITSSRQLEKFIDINFKKNSPNIMVNCSYPITKDWKKSSFKSNTLTILKRNVDMHLNSHSWIAYKFCEIMKNSKIKGSVIIFSSIYGLLGQNMNLYKNTKIKENMNYSIIKGGLATLSKQLASYYGNFGIRVNSLCSGGVLGHIKGSKIKQDKNFKKNYSKLCPLKRLADPIEIALPTVFLGSDASTYITGTNFVVDGGWTAI